MNNYRSVLAAVTGVACLAGAATQAAPFQNLGFESPILPLVPDGLGYVAVDRAFPGWQAYVGTNTESLALYNNLRLASAGISIFDQDTIEGNYTAFLQAGRYLADLGQILPASLRQVGDVPADTPLIQLKAWAQGGFLTPGLFELSLNGNSIPLTPSDTGPNYTLYTGDISAFVGQTVELQVSALYNEPYGVPRGFTFLYFDSITLVPEPAAAALLLVGLSVAGLVYRCRGRSKRAQE